MSNELTQASLDRTFVEFRPTTWAELSNLQAKLPGWIFRGQRCSTWKLETSLERTHKRISPATSITQCEKTVLERFKRGAHLVTQHLPNPKNTLEWLSLIQHYGGPTRLLDFTKSLYIAAFFALETADSDAAIWCLNAPRIRRATWEHLSSIGIENIGPELICNRLIDDGIDITATIDVEPFSLNERLIRQQGLFVMPCSPQVNVETCLFNTMRTSNGNMNRSKYDKAHLMLGSFNLTGEVLKIVLPKNIQSDGRLALRNMNIDAASLFPGLDGFARSLHSYF